MSSEYNYKDHIWGITLLPAVMEAIGIEGDVKGVRLHFEFGNYATATIMRDGYDDLVRQLPLFSTRAISEALHAPKGMQAITLEIMKDKFAICYCRYFPIEASLDGIVAALKAKE